MSCVYLIFPCTGDKCSFYLLLIVKSLVPGGSESVPRCGRGWGRSCRCHDDRDTFGNWSAPSSKGGGGPPLHVPHLRHRQQHTSLPRQDCGPRAAVVRWTRKSWLNLVEICSTPKFSKAKWGSKIDPCGKPHLMLINWFYMSKFYLLEFLKQIISKFEVPLYNIFIYTAY